MYGIYATKKNFKKKIEKEEANFSIYIYYAISISISNYNQYTLSASLYLSVPFSLALLLKQWKS
jgi:hypothetical protein